MQRRRGGHRVTGADADPENATPLPDTVCPFRWRPRLRRRRALHRDGVPAAAHRFHRVSSPFRVCAEALLCSIPLSPCGGTPHHKLPSQSSTVAAQLERDGRPASTGRRDVRGSGTCASAVAHPHNCGPGGRSLKALRSSTGSWWKRTPASASATPATPTTRGCLRSCFHGCRSRPCGRPHRLSCRPCSRPRRPGTSCWLASAATPARLQASGGELRSGRWEPRR